MEKEPTEPGGFVLEGAWGDDSWKMSVFVCGNALGRLAVVGLPAKTPHASIICLRIVGTHVYAHLPARAFTQAGSYSMSVHTSTNVNVNIPAYAHSYAMPTHMPVHVPMHIYTHAYAQVPSLQLSSESFS